MAHGTSGLHVGLSSGQERMMQTVGLWLLAIIVGSGIAFGFLKLSLP